MQGEYTLETTEECKPSQLRTEFESAKGKFQSRSINLEPVTEEVVHITARPEYNPHVGVFQIKRTSSGVYYVFSETIYTSNEFIEGLDTLLRGSTVDVRAVNFDHVPRKFSHLFETPYTLIPCDLHRVEVTLKGKLGEGIHDDHPSQVSIDGDGNTKIRQDTFQGVDFDSVCTLKMIKGRRMNAILSEIERKGEFVASLERLTEEQYRGGRDGELVGYEYRDGNDDITVSHLLFRKV